MAQKALGLIDNDQLDKSYHLIRALCHPLRISLLNLINDRQPVNVQTIYANLNLEQSITSQHLRVMREASVVLTQRKGKEIYYSVNFIKLQNTEKALHIFFKK